MTLSSLPHALGRELRVLAAVFSTLGLACAKAASPEYNPAIDPADFTIVVNNPYFTLSPGTTYRYKCKGGDGAEINEIAVVAITNQTRKVMDVTTRVVWDRVWLNGNLVEETYDWYAQDKKGNVWYFGEDSIEYLKNGRSSKHGSWEAGIDGAKPGIVMPADPHPGEPYRQEYRKGEAEDMAQVLGLNESVTVPAGSFMQCLKTKDWSAIEGGSVEHKYYSKDVGNVVLEEEAGGEKRVELIEVSGKRSP